MGYDSEGKGASGSRVEGPGGFQPWVRVPAPPFPSYKVPSRVRPMVKAQHTLGVVKITHDHHSRYFKKRKLRPRSFPSASILGTKFSFHVSFLGSLCLSFLHPHLPSLLLGPTLLRDRDAEVRKIELQVP